MGIADTKYPYNILSKNRDSTDGYFKPIEYLFT